jgi:hypothetical protein
MVAITAPELVGLSTVPFPVDCFANTPATPRLASNRPSSWADATFAAPIKIKNNIAKTATPVFWGINDPLADLGNLIVRCGLFRIYDCKYR